VKQITCGQLICPTSVPWTYKYLGLNGPIHTEARLSLGTGAARFERAPTSVKMYKDNCKLWIWISQRREHLYLTPFPAEQTENRRRCWINAGSWIHTKQTFINSHVQLYRKFLISQLCVINKILCAVHKILTLLRFKWLKIRIHYLPRNMAQWFKNNRFVTSGCITGGKYGKQNDINVCI
jgi:hypothetical protein